MGKLRLYPFWQQLKKLGEAVAPARCLRCLREEVWLCRECAQLLAPYRQRCPMCATISARGLPCRRHRGQTPLTGVISAGAYGSVHFERGVKWLKFKGVRDLAPVLAAFVVPYLPMIASLEQLHKEAVMVPIPLHKRRERRRGFNQSHDIALALSEQTGIEVADVLTRRKATWAQAKLAPGELRHKNIKDAFALRDPVLRSRSVKWVLLLDDVTTTSSTLSAAAEVLKRQLGDEVQLWGVTVARG